MRNISRGDNNNNKYYYTMMSQSKYAAIAPTLTKDAGAVCHNDCIDTCAWPVVDHGCHLALVSRTVLLRAYGIVIIGVVESNPSKT